MTSIKLIDLLDSIQAEYPALTPHRIHLSSIAICYRVMLNHGGVSDTPSPMTDEWFCGNHMFADACNSVRKIVGDAETAITKRIRAIEDVSA